MKTLTQFYSDILTESTKLSIDDIENILYTRPNRKGQNKILSLLQKITDPSSKDRDDVFYNRKTLRNDFKRAGLDDDTIDEIESIYSKAIKLASTTTKTEITPNSGNVFGGFMIPIDTSDRFRELVSFKFKRDLSNI